MSDKWEFFPSTRTANPAFVSYDDGIRDHIDQLSQRLVVRCVVKFKSPTDEGMPTQEEFHSLMSVEDELVGLVTKSGGVYVGRITTEGSRQFIFYWDTDPATCEVLEREVGEKTAYEVSTSISSDPDKRVYWDELFPTEQDWRVIWDLRVIEQLEEHGDNVSVEREIQHWVYFPNPELGKTFIPWATAAGFTVEESPKLDDSAQYGLILSHVARPDLGTISRYTLELLQEANAHGGEYDGWETFVVRQGDADEAVTH